MRKRHVGAEEKCEKESGRDEVLLTDQNTHWFSFGLVLFFIL